MDLNKNILKTDLEEIGAYYLKKAIKFIVNKEFSKGTIFFKEALDILSCDCNKSEWLQSAGDLNDLTFNQGLFEDLKYNVVNTQDYYFAKAYVLSFALKNKQQQYIALNAIEIYLKTDKDHHGYYVLGKIQANLEMYTQSLESYETAMEIKNTTAIQYRIGRLKEQEMNSNGIRELFMSLNRNPSSSCVARELQEYSHKRNLLLSSSDKESRLIKFFNENNDNFSSLYQRLIKNEDIIQFMSLVNSRNSEISEFFEILNRYTGSFLNSKQNEDKITNQKKYDYDDNYYEDDIGFNDDFYNDQLDMDQQSPEFWDNL